MVSTPILAGRFADRAEHVGGSHRTKKKTGIVAQLTVMAAPLAAAGVSSLNQALLLGGVLA